MNTPDSSRSLPAAEHPCPCGSGKPFGECCGPLLKGERAALTAEELMRSRFTAHALRDYRYLHQTYLPTAQRPYVEEAVDESDAPKWTRLEVHAHETGANPDVAFVDFTAHFGQPPEAGTLQEKSEFKRIKGTWFYTRTVRTGPAPVRSATPKVGRNEPCPCGSGKKFKHCCGA